MTDLTEIAISASFTIAISVLAGTCLVKHLLRPKPTTPMGADVPEESAPYDPAMLPPPLPMRGKVQTWFYQPLDLLGFTIIFTIFSLLIINSLRAPEIEKILTAESLGINIGFQFFLAGIATMMMFRRVRPVLWLGLRWRDWKSVIIIGPASVLCLWLLLVVINGVGYTEWMKSLGVEMEQDTVKALQTTQEPMIFILMAVTAVFVAPFCEEIVFRGYLYPVAKKFTGPWVAGACTALIFAAAHGSLAALLPLFIVGCALVYVYERTGSIWAPMAVHCCFNGATVLLQALLRYYHISIDT